MHTRNVSKRGKRCLPGDSCDSNLRPLAATAFICNSCTQRGLMQCAEPTA
jgi:hypothetical protein